MIGQGTALVIWLCGLLGGAGAGAGAMLLVVRWYFMRYLTPTQREAIADAMWRTGVP